MQEISLRDANDYVETVIFEEENCKLHIAWNDKAAQWFICVRTMGNVDLVRAISVVPNLPLFNQYRRINGMPKGELMAVVVDPDAAENQAIGRDDFLNGKFTLVYIPEVEVSADKLAMEKTIQSAFS